ncbi:MAG: AraC family transcriptional regulator [Clostridia bacterium]|nr:AraC family transcriptional regulator [Clostridia bacterium]
MFYRISAQPLPAVSEVDMLVRKTVWRCADKRNILVYVREGSCTFTIHSKDYILKKGQFLLIPAEQPYVRRPLDDTECSFTYLHFTTAEPITLVTREELEAYITKREERLERSIASHDGEDTAAERYIFLTQFTDACDMQETVLPLLDGVVAAFHQNEYYSRLSLSLGLLSLLATLGKGAMAEFRRHNLPAGGTYPPQLQRALFYINKNYKQKITIEALCAHCDVSPQHLIRLFHKHLGTTPIQFINRNKIFHAIEMLRATDLSVKEISYELGFDNPNYFSRLFKKEEKMSPSDTRYRIRNYHHLHIPSPAEKE